MRRPPALLLTVVLALCGCGTTSTPTGPVAAPDAVPSATPTRTATPADRLIAHAGVTAFAMDDQRNLLTVWSTCGRRGGLYHCRYAWKLDARPRSVTGMLPRDSLPSVEVGPGGFVIKGTDSPGVVVEPDGTAVPLRRVPPQPLSPGDVLVPARAGRMVAASPKTATTWPLTGAVGDGFIYGTVSGETAWADDGHPGLGAGATVAWSHDGQVWQRHRVSGAGTQAGPVAAAGDHVAATSYTLGDDVGPLAAWSVSTDTGRTWTDLAAADLPFFDVEEMAATPHGTLYVSSAQSGLFRSTDDTWTHFARVPLRSPVSSLVQVAGGVGVVHWQHGAPLALVVYDDAGRARPLVSAAGR